MPLEFDRSRIAGGSLEAGELLLLARFAAGSTLGGADVIVANDLGETCRSTEGARLLVVTAGKVATAVDIVVKEKSSSK